MLHVVAGLIGLQHHVTRSQVGRKGVAHTARVQQMHAIYGQVHRPVRVTHTQQVRLALGSHRLQLLLTRARMHAQSIVTSRGRVDT